MANVLVVGPHPDDQELAMGGTIALLAAQGHNVLLLDITDGEPTPFGDPQTRAAESQAAAAALSPPDRPIRRVLLGLPNRQVEHTIAARHAVAGVIRAHQAEIVFLPHPEDAHPDHVAVTRIVHDARFDAKLTKVDMPTPPGFSAIGPPIYPRWIFWYYASHLRRVPDPTFILDVSAHFEQKMASIRAYRSQFEANPRNRAVVEWIEAGARYFGSRIGAEAGEPFSSPEPLGLGSLAGLLL